MPASRSSSLAGVFRSRVISGRPDSILLASGQAQLYAWCATDGPRAPRPLCRYESIILFADGAWLLTELSNVVAYPCRPSRTEDRRHGPHPGLLWIPPAGDQCFGLPGEA